MSGAKVVYMQTGGVVYRDVYISPSVTTGFLGNLR